MKLNTLTEKIIKACYEVHNELGTGFNEKVYENALLIVLKDYALNADSQIPLKVLFRNQIVGEYYADIIVEKSIILELKTVKSLLSEHKAQLINYLKATHLTTGLIINFAAKGLEIKRMNNYD